MPDEGSPRILISRLGVIGDVVLTLPVATAIREHFPDAAIGWVVEKPAAEVIDGHADIDELITLPADWWTSIRSIKAAKRRLRIHKFETSIDCQGDNRSALAVRLSGARQRIGFARPYGGKLSRLTNTVRVTTVFPHITDRSLELLTPLGIHTPKVRWNLTLTDESRLWAVRWRQSIKSASVAILSPGATWTSKLWEIDRFAETARYLRRQYGYASVVVWGNIYDRIAAEKVAEASDGAAVVAPQTDLQHLAALSEVSDLFIGGDSGPLHLAVATGAAAIGLYGPTQATMAGPYGQIAIQQAHEKGSLRHRRDADNTAMRAISVQHVCDAIDEIERRRRFIKAA